MELREPKRKRRPHVKLQLPFPVPIESRTGIPASCAMWKNCTGRYNGDCVVVSNSGDIFRLYYQGFFGKGSLSRSYPDFGKVIRGIPPFIRQRQWELRHSWAEAKNTVCHTDALGNKEGEKALSVPQSIDTSYLNRNSNSNDVNSCSSKLKATEIEHRSKREESKMVLLNESTQNPEIESEIGQQEIQSPEENVNVCDTHQQISSEKQSVLSANQQEESMVVVLPDSDDEDENFLENMKPKLESDPLSLSEALHLTLEEAFFLSYALGCLKVVDLYGNNLLLINMWRLFCDSQKDFIQSYVAYHYFRAKNWVVKSGLKFGGDYVLYKQGPPFYHASYIVKVEVIDGKTSEKIVQPGFQTLVWTRLMGLQRLAETAAKEILLCQVVWPADLPDGALRSPTVLSKFTVQEVLVRRWVSSKEREKDWEDLL